MNVEVGSVFHEVQQFRQPLLWLFLGGMTLFLILVFGLGFFKLQAANNKFAWAFFLPPLIMLGINIMLFTSRLVTDVDTNSLSVQFLPFHRSTVKIQLENLVSHESLKINALREYGGWGIRYSKTGKAYLVGGRQGVRLTYKDGRHLFIGSKKPDELDRAIGSLAGDK